MSTFRPAFTEQNAGSVRGQICGPEADVGRALALVGELDVVVQDEVRHHRLEFVGGEEPPRTAGATCRASAPHRIHRH